MLLFDAELEPRATLLFIEGKIGVGLWSLDAATFKMEWSPGIYTLFGLTPGSVEPSLELFRSTVHPDDRITLTELHRILDKGQPIEREFRIIRKDRSVRWVANRGEILMNEEGRAERAVGILFDITKKQNVLQAHFQTENRVRTLMKGVSTLIWIASRDGRTIDIPNWSEVTGQSAADTQNMGWLGAVHPDDRASVASIRSQAFASGTPYSVCYRVLGRDGTYQWVEDRGAPVTDSGGQVKEWVGVLIFAAKPARGAQAEAALTGAQSRAARAILNWSVRDVAEATGISASTIRRLEEHDGSSNLQSDMLQRIRSAFDSAGVEFLTLPSGAPAVRPKI